MLGFKRSRPENDVLNWLGKNPLDSSCEFTDFGQQAYGAAYAAQACEETAAAKHRESPSGGVDAVGGSVRLLAHRRSITTAH